MTIENRQILFDIMRDEQSPYWYFDKHKNFCYMGVYDMEKSISKLDNHLNSVGAGYEAITISKKSNDEKGAGGHNIKNSNIHYIIKTGKTTDMQTQSPMDYSYIEKIGMLERKIIENKYEVELDKLRERIAEIESEDFEEEDNSIGAIIQKQITPHLPMIIAKLCGININEPTPTTILSGMGYSEEQQVCEKLFLEEQEKCKQACEELLKHDSYAGTHLLMLADLCKNKNDTYNFALKYLKGL